MTQRQRHAARGPAVPPRAVVDRVRALCEDIVRRRDLELVELTLAREGRTQMLRITVDNPAGDTSLEAVERTSEEISRALDAEDPIEGRYLLEVSSAGLERPLVRPADYRRFTGRQVKVRTHEPVGQAPGGAGGRKVLTGTIRSAGEDGFELEEAGGSIEIPYAAVARARLVVDWENELRGRPSGRVPGDAMSGAPAHGAAMGSEGGKR